MKIPESTAKKLNKRGPGRPTAAISNHPPPENAADGNPAPMAGERNHRQASDSEQLGYNNMREILNGQSYRSPRR
ncbi:MAG TPA: hypothetical protein VJQ52_22460 [Steroidobacteraceae bacterium]|nr:hypothetical protein [Steroidobacteraceae bacterium]